MPSKEQIRQWMQQRQQAKTVPPSPAEIRRALGWGLNIPAKNTACER